MQSTKKRAYTPRLLRDMSCKWCQSAYQTRSNNSAYCSAKCKESARYDRDRDKRIQEVRDYRAKNAEAISARRRSAYIENREERLAENKRNYAKHRASRVAAALEYQRSNPDVVTRTRNKRRAALSFDISSRDMRRLLARFRHRCAYCTRPLGPQGKDSGLSLQWDHVVPLSRGGANSVANLAPSCRDCNMEKSAKFLTEWRNRWYIQREIDRVEAAQPRAEIVRDK